MDDPQPSTSKCIIRNFEDAYRLEILEEIEEYKSRHPTCLTQQAEISAQVGDEVPKLNIQPHHGFHIPEGYKIGKVTSFDNSFYDSFGQGLKALGIVVTVDELKFKCEFFLLNYLHYLKLSKDKNINAPDSVDEETWNYFAKIVNIKHRRNKEVVQGWILCNVFNVTLFFIDTDWSDGEVVGKCVTQIIDNNDCVTFSYAFCSSGKNTVTIANLGAGRFEPVLSKLTQILDGRFGDYVMINGNIKFNKPITIDMKDEVSTKNNLKHDKETNDILNILNSLESTISENAIDQFKEHINNLSKFDINNLKDVFNDNRNPLKNTNLIILACKYNKLNFLQYIIHECNILYDLPSNDQIKTYDFKDDAINYAIKNMNIDMLVILYDYFLDDLHWSCENRTEGIIKTLQEICAILIKAWMNCYNILKENLQKLKDVHCLIEVTKYQIELYSKLSEICYDIPKSEDNKIAETETVVNILLTVLRTYQKYNLKCVRLRSRVPGLEQRLQIIYADQTSSYQKMLEHFTYELYYKKLDASVTLLILDNLHYLQQRLNLPGKTYKEIESAVFYFIYRVYEDWRLILPINRERARYEYVIGKNDHYLVHEGALIYDRIKLKYFPVIYLSRKEFSKSLYEFENVLKDIEIENNLRKKGQKIPNAEIYTLPLLPIMRDNISLRKILAYLDTISKINLEEITDFDILIIERTIQVTGELFKNSDETLHVDPLTKSLLALEIPAEVINLLEDLRDLLSHADKVLLLRRIYVGKNKGLNCFKEILKDLAELKERIYEVINLYGSVIDIWIVMRCLELISVRNQELHVKEFAILKKQLLYRFPTNNTDAYIQYENKLMQEHKISRQLLREIQYINDNLDELAEIYRGISIYTIRLVLIKLDKFAKDIRKTLLYIENNYERNSNECHREWKFIVKIFEYVVTVVGFFDNHHYEISASCYSNMIGNIKGRNNNRSGLAHAYNLLAAIENHATTYVFSDDYLKADTNTNISPHYEFAGLKSYKFNLDHRSSFILEEELQHVLDDFQTSYGDKADEVYRRNERLFKYLKESTPMKGKDIQKLCLLNLNEESKKFIRCLDMGSKRKSKLPYCFENRINLLKNLVGSSDKSVQTIALQFKHDQKFRLSLEMILVDIMNILMYIKQKHILKKKDKMYTDANIRNILEHSEPLLENIGTALDPNDFASALAKKAQEFLANSNDWLPAIEKLNK